MRLFDSKKIKTGLIVSELLFTVFGLTAHYFNIHFLDNHEMLDLLEREEARAAYLPIEVFTALETAFFLILTSFMAIGFIGFIKKHTGIDPDAEGYNKTERQYHRKMTSGALVFFCGAALVQVLKCVKVFLDAKIELIFTNTDVIVTSPLPWLGWAIVGVCVLLICYAFYYISDVKNDVRFKYDMEEHEQRRGAYE